MGCTYVKDFDFGSKGKDGTVKYAMGGKVQAPGFKGQNMHPDTGSLGIKGNKNPGIKGSKPVAPDLPTQKLAMGGMARGPAPMPARGRPAPAPMQRPSPMPMQKPAPGKVPPTMSNMPVRTPPKPLPGKVPPPTMSTMPVDMKSGGKVMQAKVGKVMGEFKAGELHSGSKTGPVVKNPKQAVAIALSEGRKAAKR